MKFNKFILTALLAGASMSMMAQGYKDGIEYYKADRYGNAKILLDRNLNAPGTDKAASYYYLGMLDLYSKKNQTAKEYFEKGIADNPNYAFNYVGLGALALKEGDVKAAEKEFKLAESKGKKDAAVQVAIADAYYRANSTLYAKEVQKRIDKARKINLNDPSIYMLEGDMFADNRDWGSAAGRYEMATGFDSSAVEGYVKGSDMYAQVNPQYGIKLLQQLLAVNPNSAIGQKELAERYYDQQMFNEAADMYGKYVKNPNHFTQDEDRYAFLLFYGSKYKEGYDFATRLLSQNPKNFTAQRFQFMNAAQLPEMTEQTLALAENLLAAHNVDKKNNLLAPIDYSLIADEFKRAGRYDEAVEVLKEGIAELPTYNQFHKDLAGIYWAAQNYPGASDALEAYLTKVDNPSGNDCSLMATYSFYGGYSSKDNKESANKYFDRALKYANLTNEKLPTFYKGDKVIGDVAIQQASDANVGSCAVDSYTKALNKIEADQANAARYASDATAIAQYLGSYYAKQGDKAKAREFYNIALKYAPDDANLQKAVNALK